MKLRKQRSITYKTHVFSAFCRSLFTNACWIFSTSLFVKVVGSKGYSQLFFFASLCSLIYYLYFAFRGHKPNEPYHVYRAVVFLAFLSSLACFAEPYVAFLHSANEMLLYLFVVSVMTVDLVGTTLGPIVLQSSVSPAIFRQVYQNIITAELAARITAAVVVWLLSTAHQLTYLYPIAWLLLLLHTILFGITVWRMRVAELKARLPHGDRPRVMENVGSSLKFMFANPLVRIAMSAMVWATITKFVIENLFYQNADANFGSARQLASFVSGLTIVIYSLSLVLHHFLNTKLNSRLQLSTLLSLQPINVLVLAGVALVIPPFWPLVLLMVTYNIIHRSVQLPMSRQCLVPVPRSQRATIVALISIVISIATILTSGVMAVMKDMLQMEDFLVLLLVLGSTILFMITSLDSFYIRNLWSFFQETRSGRWQDESQNENLSTFSIDQSSENSDGFADTLKSSDPPILETYARSSNPRELETATQSHKQLLTSDRGDLRLSALRICFESNFPWFKPVMLKAASHADMRIRKFAERALWIDQEFTDNTHQFSSVFRKRLRSIAMDFLESDESSLEKLKYILSCDDRDAIESLVSVLANPQFKAIRPVVLDCIVLEGMRLSPLPLVEHMYQLDFADAQIFREVLENLTFGKNNSELRTTIQNKLTSLRGVTLVLGQERGDEHAKTLETFMHTLFLEEYRLLPHRADKALTSTIADFPTFSSEEIGILIDMHLSFLKRSDYFHTWEAIML